MSARLRRPGGRWRLLVHHWAGREPGRREGGYDVSHHVSPDPAFGGQHPDSAHSRTHLIEGTEFDELVVGSFLHVEQIGIGLWWINVGGVVVHVEADRDGRPRDVWVCGPKDYDEPREGCTYRLNWGKHVEEPGQAGSGSVTMPS